MNPESIIALLTQTGALSSSVAQNLMSDPSLDHKRIDTIIFEHALLSRDEFYHSLSEALGIDYYDISEFEPTQETLQLVPPPLVRRYGILPLFRNATTLYICLSDPCNCQALEELYFILELPFQQVLADIDRVCFLIQSHYGSRTSAPLVKRSCHLKEISESIPSETSYAVLESSPAIDTTPIAHFVDLILEKAAQSRASDVHLEPFEAELKIRYRVDGTLYELTSPPPHLASAIVSYIKILAHLDIAERRTPQDGRIQYVLNGRPIDLRVSTLPTAFGESIVLRVLDRTAVQLDLERLGMPEEVFHSVRNTIRQPNGIFIITGPTGSGKTTTLYSCLREINRPDSKLLTVEDPVEYEIDGVLQVPINENIGLTFARVLRTFLRQDPDCMMVGEIRDAETAEIAIQASLTGHLIFATLHTKDTVSAITRLMNFGIHPSLLSTTLTGILAQRLIRTICPHCRKNPQLSDTPSAKYQKPHNQEGCEICNHTGYLGRKGIYEFLSISPPIRELIYNRSPEPSLRKKAQELGMVSLQEEALRCVHAGESSREEIMKHTDLSLLS